MQIIREYGNRLGFAFGLIAVVVFAGWLAYSSSLRHNLMGLRADTHSRLAFAKATLFLPTDKYSYLPELLAGHPVVINALLHKRDARHVRQANLLLEQLNKSARAEVIYIEDVGGTTIAASNWLEKNSFVGRNHGQHRHFEETIKLGTSSFYGTGVDKDQPGYYLAHVVQHGKHALGSVVVKVELGTLDKEWRTLGGEVVVTDEDGVIFLSSRPDWKYRTFQSVSRKTIEERRTQRYDSMLRPPISLIMRNALSDDERIVSVLQPRHSDDGLENVTVDYLLKSETLNGSHWTISVLMPMVEVETRALRTAVMSSGAVALLVLALMYLQQAIHRSNERQRSLAELSRTHIELEQKHLELQRLSEDLRTAAITDPLTGAYNRRFFFESVPKLVASANRHGFPLSIVTIDIDHFKRINDEYGHDGGDRVLQMLTSICKETLREADIFARFGGEEFVMALPNTDANMAKIVAERVRQKAMEHPVQTKNGPIRITISGGISQYATGEPDIEPTLKRSDEALYEAKETGRNRIVVH